jgi:hypothetical protein
MCIRINEFIRTTCKNAIMVEQLYEKVNGVNDNGVIQILIKRLCTFVCTFFFREVK